MLGIMPTRASTLTKLIQGGLAIIGLSILNLAPLSWGVLGSFWPMFLLWGICGWLGLGPNIAVTFGLILLGFWLDVIYGTAPATWVLLALATYSFMLLANRYLGTDTASPIVRCAIAGAVLLGFMGVFELWLHGQFSAGSAFVSIAFAVGLYPFVARLYDLSEDEA